MTDYDDLRAKAMAATPGPWKWGWRNDDVTPGSVHTDEPNCRAVAMCPRYGKREFKRDAAYIAAANPAVILALLDEIATLRSALRAILAVSERHDTATMNVISDCASTAIDRARGGSK